MRTMEVDVKTIGEKAEEKAFAEGQYASTAAFPASANPYPDGSRLYRVWEKGYHSVHSALLDNDGCLPEGSGCGG